MRSSRVDGARPLSIFESMRSNADEAPALSFSKSMRSNADGARPFSISEIIRSSADEVVDEVVAGERPTKIFDAI